MRKVYVIVIAIVLLGLAPLLAEDSSGVISIPRMVPASGGQAAGALVTLVTVGLNDPVLPCFFCVTGASQISLGLSLPLTWVPGGSSVTFSVVLDDIGYTGPGLFVYSLRSGNETGKVVQRGQTAASVYPASWIAWFRTVMPTKPGYYTLDGIFDAGGTTSLVSVPVIIQ